MLKVRLLFFAVLREIAGKDEDVLELPPGSRAGDVWQHLRARYPALRDYPQAPMLAINEQYAAIDELLHDGDEVAFIPPVAGG